MLKMSVLASVLLASLAVPLTASAAPVEISWSDLGAQNLACGTGCINYSVCTYPFVDYSQGTVEMIPYPCEPCVQYGEVCTASSALLPDGDVIELTIQRSAVPADSIEFRLGADTDVTWWKQIKITDGADTWRLWTYEDMFTRFSYCNWPEPETHHCDTIGHWSEPTLGWGELVFSKAKFLGIHQDVYTLHNLDAVLNPGDRVTFRWVED